MSDKVNETVYTINHPYLSLDRDYDMLMTAMQVSVSKHILDEDFTVIWANDFYYAMTGYTKEEYESLYHNSVREYYRDAADQYEKMGETVTEAIADKRSGYTFVSRMPVKGGRHIWIKVVGIFTDELVDGKPVLYSVFTDVSEIVDVKTEQSVAYNNIPGFVAKFKVKSNMKFEFVEANEKFVRFFGRRSENDEPYGVLNCYNDKNRRIIEARYGDMRAGRAVSFTVQDKDCAGNDVWLKINAECIGNKDGDPVYLFVYIDITDITEQKVLQKKLEKQSLMLQSALEAAESANRAKSDFLSRMSHDIRTPMNAIIGMTNVAKTMLDNPDKLSNCLSKLEISAQFLLSLINDILDMSKIESGKMTLKKHEFDLADFLRDLTAMFISEAHKKDIGFYVEADGILDEKFIGDELKLKQILINILGNAVKYTDNGGNIKLSIRQEIVSDQSTQLIFTVIDDGVGMDKEFLGRLFKPFEQSPDSDRRGGSGLGLAIAQNFAGLMNGGITVESEKGKGSRFTVKVWLDNADAFKPHGHFVDVNTVVVENDKTALGYSRELISRFGINGYICDNAEDAVKRLDETVSGYKYNVLVTPWKLAGIDGESVIKKVRRFYPKDVLIIAVNAFEVAEIKPAAKKAGADMVVSRPMFPSAVNDLLMNITGGKDIEIAEEEADEKFDGGILLLAEDNDINLEIAQIILENVNLKVETARDGKEAVELFEARPDGYFSAVLMDIQMPVMNGYEATAEIRGSKLPYASSVPILAMSANAFDDDVQKSLDSGMNGHISKPIDVKALYDRLHRILK